MVVRTFQVLHNDSNFDLDYDTGDGFEVFQFQLYSLTSVPPDQQKIYGAEHDTQISTDSDLATISDKLRLVSIHDQPPKPESNSAQFLQSDEELARLLQAEEEALMLQQYVASENTQEFESRVRPYVSQVLMYEDEIRQEAARKSVPVDELEEKALVSLTKEGNFNPSKIERDHAFLLQLLFWFKQSFRWVNAPSCRDCGNETVGQGMTAPLPSETLYGASRVEQYRLWKQERAAVENGPIALRSIVELLVMSHVCLLVDLQILDFTDHVWTECYSQLLGRWMHLDPCEAIYDRPLLYEKGWNKKLNYVIAIAKDGVYDVTKRYTRKWHEVLSRRTMATEPSVSSILTNITNETRRGFAPQLLSIIEARDIEENQQIERSLHSEDDESLSLPGRRSGNEQWRKSRSEIGSDNLSSSACPVRLCVDEHVTKIYNAFRPVLHQFIAEEVTKAEAVEVLGITKRILLDLSSSPFKSRRASIDSVLSNPKFQKLLPSFGDLLDALSLEKKATSAFDGTQISKWEEPNGAKGCWIVYRTFDDKKYELVAYELMSANDAPERDPMDWILEGSNDEGNSWQVLDKQTSQFFKDRFQRRTYMINSAHSPSNLFRFRFLAVKDTQSTSRLQIGSIDLYTKTL
ncbi:hypothetical protein TSUD_346070 [Trifolium subterraneum]|nr:hypothetical protein TSUD_346070 [Trifolium subterraneum]